jgi:hypothetical protein
MAGHGFAAESPVDAFEDHIDALNERNDKAVIASQRFPFGHLWPDGRWAFVESPADYEPFDFATLGLEWHRSVIESAEHLVSNEDAATYRIIFSRRRVDDSVMGRYEAVWIATNVHGDWRVQFRHGALQLK